MDSNCFNRLRYGLSVDEFMELNDLSPTRRARSRVGENDILTEREDRIGDILTSIEGSNLREEPLGEKLRSIDESKVTLRPVRLGGLDTDIELGYAEKANNGGRE